MMCCYGAPADTMDDTDPVRKVAKSQDGTNGLDQDGSDLIHSSDLMIYKTDHDLTDTARSIQIGRSGGRNINCPLVDFQSDHCRINIRHNVDMVLFIVLVDVVLACGVERP
ncbi:hypothetical protein PsorP6_007642 [Peronosclerospora sorghi]|uniref:Uncharacterized protein n=1 Tax=Peronosclerospora sorghi TaxID=230839 RepID=A0ACC0W803_9STRA|nr:hypothetical protein PsorP6_007642 [Peronosclerospora sorghi]